MKDPDKRLVPIAHAVALIGYNNDEGYWIAKNSWGPRFGMNGFFLVSGLGDHVFPSTIATCDAAVAATLHCIL